MLNDFLLSYSLESVEAIQVLRENGLKNILVSGDNEREANSLIVDLGMGGYFVNVLPHEKL